MRDGTNLAANVDFPTNSRPPFPVLLTVTPYGKDGSGFQTTFRSEIRSFAKAGYAVVHVDVRGRGNSEGKFSPFFQEINDGYDCIEWAGKQSWSNGTVGTFGRSYGGIAQLYPLRFRSKYHKAALIMTSPSIHPFRDVTGYIFGAFFPLMLVWALEVSGRTVKEEINDEEIDWDLIFKIRPLKNWSKFLGLQENIFGERYSHETYDKYFKKIWTDGMINLVNVPCYFISGWYDDCIRGALEHFPDLTSKHPDKGLRKKHKLLMGPWPHLLSLPLRNTSKVGDFDYGPQSIIPISKEAIRWFDYNLKGIDNGISEDPAVRVFLMGANRWIDSNEFPVAGTREKVMYLNADGPANTLYGKGKLYEEPSDDGDSTSSEFTYDPKKPAPSPYTKVWGGQNGTNEDLRYIQKREDVLVYTSSRLEKPLNVMGRLFAVLFVSTSAVDTDFVARLSDVYPNGYAQRLNHGVNRLRFREGFEKTRLVKPGEIVQISIDMLGTGTQFRSGHRVRLDITSSAVPAVAPNYNSGENSWEETHPVVATNTVYHSKKYPSRIILPELSSPKFSKRWTSDRWIRPR
jgi:uncharacterized protein